jgi:hypothetical protein
VKPVFIVIRHGLPNDRFRLLFSKQRLGAGANESGSSGSASRDRGKAPVVRAPPPVEHAHCGCGSSQSMSGALDVNGVCSGGAWAFVFADFDPIGSPAASAQSKMEAALPHVIRTLSSNRPTLVYGRGR